MIGRIVKGVGGFYYVEPADSKTKEKNQYECRAKGIFRERCIKPLVGDIVDFDILPEKGLYGTITNIHKRKNELKRPAVSNVDQALLVFSIKSPVPDFILLDKLLVTMKKNSIPAYVCINKTDLADKDDIKNIENIYSAMSDRFFFTIALDGKKICFRDFFTGKTTVLAGSSGVGKSSLINALYGKNMLKTGAVSQKINRGKHTTRHSQIFELYENTYILDTPGFTSYYLDNMRSEELKEYYDEFRNFETECRFNGCVHIKERDCAVRDAVNKGLISDVRYMRYKFLYEELKEQNLKY